MAKLPRKEQKIFAENATNNGQFGSAQEGTKVKSNDIETLQALENYEQGWKQATVGSSKLPTLEELQGLSYINTYQIKYLMERGIGQWHAQTTYYKNSYVVGSDTALYMSVADNNIGNNPTLAPDNWMKVVDASGNVSDGGITLTEWEDFQGELTLPFSSRSQDPTKRLSFVLKQRRRGDCLEVICSTSKLRYGAINQDNTSQNIIDSAAWDYADPELIYIYPLSIRVPNGLTINDDDATSPIGLSNQRLGHFQISFDVGPITYALPNDAVYENGLFTTRGSIKYAALPENEYEYAIVFQALSFYAGNTGRNFTTCVAGKNIIGSIGTISNSYNDIRGSYYSFYGSALINDIKFHVSIPIKEWAVEEAS